MLRAFLTFGAFVALAIIAGETFSALALAVSTVSWLVTVYIARDTKEIAAMSITAMWASYAYTSNPAWVMEFVHTYVLR